MSTYLLAWFIGEYAGKTVESENGVSVSIFAPKDKLKMGMWALSVAEKTLTFYEEYFGIKYPLKKLDMLAISDFVNGAMENWGLVTYRDRAIYCDETSSLAAKEYVTSVVAHELAHQWFGNLVTMEWWSQLWLNEGNATFMQSLANAAIYPQFDIWTSFAHEKLEMALSLDSKLSSHSVEIEIEKASQINEVFDVISYRKGASLLKMLHEYIGDKAFRAGMTKYLKHYSYRNADSDGLWKFLAKESEKDVSGFMELFTRRQGYPKIDIELVSIKGKKHTFRLRQSRFLTSGKTTEKTIWKVPIKIDVSGEKKWVYMHSEVMEVDFDIPEFKYILLNADATGFFRSKHSKALAEKLMANMGGFPAKDRFMIVSDCSALFTAGEKSAAEMLFLLESLENEENNVVWTAAIGAIEKMRCLLRGSSKESEERLDAFSISLKFL
ncbi:hypothetical protein MHBO_002824 [Bonamia ostreae]|uniref:Uncharacterized protein n=1 Tax=Bonamia ostreae TaxID=126728 RepID=A0ABV2ANN1_9EUKA